MLFLPWRTSWKFDATVWETFQLCKSSSGRVPEIWPLSRTRFVQLARSVSQNVTPSKNTWKFVRMRNTCCQTIHISSECRGICGKFSYWKVAAACKQTERRFVTSWVFHCRRKSFTDITKSSKTKHRKYLFHGCQKYNLWSDEWLTSSTQNHNHYEYQ